MSARAPAASLLLQRSIPRSAYDFIRSRLINPYTDVLDENAVVFVHIPKTAGKALFGSLFAAPSPGHITARRYRSFDPDRFQRYFKFAVGRNPWDRTVSAFHFLKQGGTAPIDALWARRYLSDIPDFSAFAYALKDERFRRRVLSWIHFIPQHEFLASRDGSLLVDYVARYENLPDAFAELTSRLDLAGRVLTTANRSEHAPYWEYYDDASAALIGEIYRLDVTLLEYSFPEEMLHG